MGWAGGFLEPLRRFGLVEDIVVHVCLLCRGPLAFAAMSTQANAHWSPWCNIPNSSILSFNPPTLYTRSSSVERDGNTQIDKVWCVCLVWFAAPGKPRGKPYLDPSSCHDNTRILPAVLSCTANRSAETTVTHPASDRFILTFLIG